MSNTFSCVKVLSDDFALRLNYLMKNVHLPTLERPCRADKTDQSASFRRQGSSAVTLDHSYQTGQFPYRWSYSPVKVRLFLKSYTREKSVFLLSIWQIISFVATRAGLITAATLKIPDKCPFHCRQHKRYLRRKQVRSPPHSFCKHSLWLLAPGVEVHWVN